MNWYQESSQATVISTSAADASEVVALACGAPERAAIPAIVRGMLGALKRSSARSILSWAFVGTART